MLNEDLCADAHQNDAAEYLGLTAQPAAEFFAQQMARKAADVLVNFFAILVLSLPCVLGYNVLSGFMPFGEGSAVLDLEDFLVSNTILPLGSLVYLLFCTSRYGWGWKNFVAEADEGKGIRFPKWARVYVSYILPLIVLFIFLMGYKDKFFT